MFRVLFVLALLLAPFQASAQQVVEDRVGDVYQIRVVATSENTSSDGGSGSSRSGSTMMERVVAVRADGVELEFDLPADTPAEDRARHWQYPVRVLKPLEGALELLNGAEMETRLQAWMKTYKLPPEACGQWVFTWTANKIECDPRAALALLEPFDLRRAGLRDGMVHVEAMALAPGELRMAPSTGEGATFVAKLAIDPEAVRRQYAEADAIVAQMMGNQSSPVAATMAAKAAARASARISGTIETTLKTDAAGRVTERRRETRFEVATADETEQKSTIETTQRVLVPR